MGGWGRLGPTSNTRRSFNSSNQFLIEHLYVLGAGKTMVNKIGVNPCPREAAILAETANSKQTSQYIMSGCDECPEEMKQ